jgi:hypothetical protein
MESVGGRSTAVHRPQPNADGVVFGVDREGNPHHGPQIDGYPRLKSDGSTASGLDLLRRPRSDKVNKANHVIQKIILATVGVSPGRAIAVTY